MPTNNIPHKGRVGSLKPDIKFSDFDGQVYTVLAHEEKKTLAIHQTSGKVYSFDPEKLVAPHTTLLYSSGV